MRRYYFELVDDNYNGLGAFIPDGSCKKSAVNRARKWMQENHIQNAILAVNSLTTNNLIDTIDIELN